MVVRYCPKLFYNTDEIKGEPTSDSPKIAQGETFTLSFDWSIVNNIMTEQGRVYKYVADLDLENLAIVPKDGWLYSDGTHIGSYSVTEDGTFTVELIPEEVENESNVAGGAIIAASLDADADRTIPDGAQITVSAADFTNDIIY